MTHQGWVASLSDGSQRFEQPPKEGEASSWQKLLTECKTSDLEITGMALVRNGIRIVAMPHKMTDGYFQAYEVHKMLFRGSGPGEQRILQGIGSVVGDYVYITWIDLSTRQIKQDFRDRYSSKFHIFEKEVHNDGSSNERGSK